MQAPAQDQQCHAVHMEIVSASGAPAKSHQECRYDQKYYPDAEQGAHGLVGGGYVVGCHYGGNVHQHRAEEEPAAFYGCIQDTGIRRLVDRLVLHSLPPGADRMLSCLRVIF